ncbi:uncharacterized protein A1O5_08494 [Cladophialophora psammophila CBS 110553]|uniref:Uncharacterized protein n=1 Tax=Cladophialophora psammophila CBS 110553 TaxID=1182543 RepID=W9WUH6_9EURO|nr:uncharacterized protein A1O5_08494 [Cladophialophora psammophila CBS 110553]EXJ68700.1 hypothetical protein A1O5_08494 [Cladophialophora psammophila CBS 110553]
MQDVGESETDDRYGGDDMIQENSESKHLANDSQDSYCSEEANFSGVGDSQEREQGLRKEDVEVDVFDGRDKPWSSTAQIREVAEEDPAAETLSDSSFEYYNADDGI